MKECISREAALAALKAYNKEPFHILHGLTVEGVMRWYANELGYGEDADFWATVGLLHDIDFEMWPEQHCRKAPELLKKAGCSEEFIHAVCSHGYGLCCDVEPTHEMEKVLFAADELTGLIGAAARMRPSKSVMDMEVSSLKKKYKDKKFAAGCSRDVINTGAERLGWTIEELMEKTILAMRSCEESVNKEMETLAYYLDCWRGVFAASSTAQAVGLFGAELAVVLGAAAVFLLLGLSAVGPLPIFLFAMLYGTGSGLLSAQLLNNLGAKQLVLFLLTASLPTALATGALCLFGASALQVSSRIHAFSFGRGDKGSHPAGARLLVGQFALLAVCLCPLCGAATGLVCLANRLMQAG